jgi:hypothetical protein
LFNFKKRHQHSTLADLPRSDRPKRLSAAQAHFAKLLAIVLTGKVENAEETSVCVCVCVFVCVFDTVCVCVFLRVGTAAKGNVQRKEMRDPGSLFLLAVHSQDRT